MGRLGESYLRRSKDPNADQQNASRVDSDPMPRVFWDESGENVPPGRCATYTHATHIITANATFDFYLNMVEWARLEAEKRSPGNLDDKALRSMCVHEVRRWFEEALMGAVIVMRPKSHDGQWGPRVFETALSDEGLTSAVVSHRWLMMSAIKKAFGQQFGAPRTVASADV